jgi:hypothetical protein
VDVRALRGSGAAGARPRFEVGRLGVLALFCLLIAVGLGRAVQVASKEPTDVQIFYEAARLAVDGGDPYAASDERFPYIYPSLLLWIFEPFSRLEYLDGVLAWAIVCAAAWVGMVFLGLRICWPEDRTVPAWAYVAVAVLPYRWVLGFLTHGQVDMVTCFLLVVSCALALRRRDVAAGFALALAVVIKLLPAVFFGYYALRGRWRVVASGVAFGALLFVAPVARFGPARFVEMLDQWRRGPLLSEIQDPGSDAQESNQGLAATIYRYGLPKPFEHSYDDAPAWFALSTSTVTRIYALAALAVLCMWGATLVGTRHDTRLDALCFAMTFVVLHLVCRRSWQYHYVSMTFVYAAVLGALAHAWSAALRGPLTASLVAVAVLQNFYAPVFLGKATSGLVSSYGPTTLSFLVLIAAFALVARRVTAPTTHARIAAHDPAGALACPA